MTDTEERNSLPSPPDTSSIPTYDDTMFRSYQKVILTTAGAAVIIRCLIGLWDIIKILMSSFVSKDD